MELADEGLERRWNEQEARKVENSGDLSIKMIFSTMETILFAKNKDCPLKLSCDRLKKSSIDDPIARIFFFFLIVGTIATTHRESVSHRS